MADAETEEVLGEVDMYHPFHGWDSDDVDEKNQSAACVHERGAD